MTKLVNKRRYPRPRPVVVARHEPTCPVLRSGPCDCEAEPESEKVKYQRVCAACGGELEDRRRPYCSKTCRDETQVRGKSIEERHNRTQEYQARGP